MEPYGKKQIQKQWAKRYRWHEDQGHDGCFICGELGAGAVFFCATHEEEYRDGPEWGYEETMLWAAKHPDWEKHPILDRCPRCEEIFVPDKDYVCEDCRWGSLEANDG